MPDHYLADLVTQVNGKTVTVPVEDANRIYQRFKGRASDYGVAAVYIMPDQGRD